MDINEMTRKEFGVLPHRKWNAIIEFNSFVILPGLIEDKHDSGYRSMDFVAVTDDGPLCLLSGCSDVIHIEGIGGYGKDYLEKYNGIPQNVPPSNWSIDCLLKSGLLHMWPGSGKMTCGPSLSSFEVYALPKDDGV